MKIEIPPITAEMYEIVAKGGKAVLIPAPGKGRRIVICPDFKHYFILFVN